MSTVHTTVQVIEIDWTSYFLCHAFRVASLTFGLHFLTACHLNMCCTIRLTSSWSVMWGLKTATQTMWQGTCSFWPKQLTPPFTFMCKCFRVIYKNAHRLVKGRLISLHIAGGDFGEIGSAIDKKLWALSGNKAASPALTCMYNEHVCV